MMPSRMRFEVRSQYNLKFDPGVYPMGAPPPPWEAQGPPGVEMSSCMRAVMVDLCCRALDYRHACVVHSFERPVDCSSPLFSACISLFTFFTVFGYLV